MAIKNSEFRAFAAGAKSEPSSNTGLIAVALVAMVGLGGAYAYKIGFFSRSKPVAVAQQTQNAPQTTQAKPADSPALSSAAVAATPAPVRVDPRDANEALGRVMNVVLKDGGNLLKRIDYMGSFEGMMKSDFGSGKKNAPPRRIDPKDVVMQCMEDMKSRFDHIRGMKKGEEGYWIFMLLSEMASCSMRRGEKLMCEAKPREQVLAQVKYYDTLRSDALNAVSKDPRLAQLVSAAFTMGVHEDMNRNLRQLGAKGYLKSTDFSYFPSKYVKDSLDEFKAVKSACT